MTNIKPRVAVFLMISMSIMMIISASATGITAQNLEIGNATTTSSQGTTWQLREFKTWSFADPYVSYSANGSMLLVDSNYLSDGAMGNVFLVVDRAELDGKMLQVHWNAFYTYPDSRDLGFLSMRVFEGALNRTDMTSYFLDGQDRITFFGIPHIEATHYPAPLGAWGWFGWRTDISSALNLTGWSSNQVTIMISLADFWAFQETTGAIEWLNILDSNGTTLNNFSFAGSVAMEVTGTTHDYGLFTNEAFPLMYVNPSLVEKGINESFTVNVEVQNVTDLYSWEFELYYSNAVLNATEVVEGPFLQSAGYTLWMDYSTPGLVHVGASLTGEISGVNGGGVIATITFITVGSGNSPLTLQGTILMDSSVAPIPHNTADGNVAVQLHDIAVTSIMTDKTVVGNSSRTPITISVTVKNNGYYPESFDITLYANATAINSTDVSLGMGESMTLEFIWRPADMPRGDYILGAIASIVPGETDVNDNILYSSTPIAVAMVGDITGQEFWPDGAVNIQDVAFLALSWGSHRGDARYNPNCDINNSGSIDITDVALLARNWGKFAP